MSDVFISYSRADTEHVKALRRLLESEGLSVWWDAKLYGGDKFEQEIEKQLHKSKAVIVVWSEASTASKFVHAEARIAFENDRLLPLSIEPVNIDEIPFTMRGIHIESLETWCRTGNPADAAEALDSVRRMVEQNRTRSDEAKTDATVELAVFQAIALSEDPTDWEDYLRRFPNGRFRDIARKKRRKLLRYQGETDPRASPQATGKRAPKFALMSLLALGLAGAGVTSPIGLGLWGPAPDQKIDSTGTIGGTEVGTQVSTNPAITPPPPEEVTDFEVRRQALLDAAEAFDKDAYSDSEANTAIRTANALSDEEIASEEELIKALETTIDSFFNAGRYDFVARVEAEHKSLFEQHAEFYVSFCLRYGQKLLSVSPVSANDIWTLDDPGSFERDLAKYNEYAKLDVVRQRFPEYAILFEPGILKLQGASEERIHSRIARTPTLAGQDKQNFINLLETSASEISDPQSASASVIVLTERYRDLVAEYASLDPSGTWTRVGILTGIDMTRQQTSALP